MTTHLIVLVTVSVIIFLLTTTTLFVVLTRLKRKGPSLREMKEFWDKNHEA